jgi:hypothetical protein
MIANIAIIVPMHMEPAKTIIDRFGGVEVVAAITGRHVSRVYRWMYPRDRGGTGGLIPQGEARKLLAHAKASNIPVSADEFFLSPEPAEES